MQKSLIICNGAKEPAAFLKALSKGRTVICADGGANIARAAGVKAHFITGDLDSVTQATRRAFKNASWTEVSNQNNTDFEKAFELVKELKISDVCVVCATGKRLDFTLSNLHAAFKYLQNINIVFRGKNWSLTPVAKSAKFKSAPNARVSIIPLTPCQKVTLTGLKYSLKNVNLDMGQTLTLSNVALKNNFEVKIQKGRLFVYIEDL